VGSRAIDITPHTSLFPKLGYAGYSIPQAIAELVDNSIDAIIDDQKLVVSIHINRDEITVADNAYGMDAEDITNSMTLAYSIKKGKLGEFGLGLKTACLSLGERFSIKTKCHNIHKEYNVTFDEAEWKCAHEGWRIILYEEDAETDHHYTIVQIGRLKRFYPNLPNYIKTDLQRRFAPFILNDDLELLINGKPCTPEKIELLNGTRKEFSIRLTSGNLVHGWYGLLKQGSQKGLYGFTTFRRGRMITHYDKIGIGEHPTISRIVGELHMDYVPVTTSKREFERESDQYREVEAALKKEFKEIIRLARQKAGEEKVTKEVTQQMEDWKDRIAEAVNSEEFKTYTTKLLGTKIERSEADGETGVVEVEKRKSPEKSGEQKPEPKEERKRIPQKTHPKKRHVVRIKGRNVEFVHQFAQLGIEASWKNVRYEAGKRIEIFTNTDFPAFHATRDQVFYAVMTIAEAISEVLVQQAEEDIANIDEVKELILRKAAILKLQLND
jgi:hypothetical protein